MISPHREEAVWQRVLEASAQAPAPAAPRNPQQILELWNQTRQDRDTYRMLARTGTPTARQSLRQLALEEQRQADLFAAIYYLLTNKPPQGNRTMPKSTSLAQCCEQALIRIGSIAALAQIDDRFSCILRTMVQAKVRRTETLLQLLGQSITSEVR